MPPRLQLHNFEITQWPAPVKVRLRGFVEAEVREPVAARHSGNPVALESFRRLRPAVDIHGPVRVFLQIHARRLVGDPLLVDEQRTRVDVVERDGPEELHRRVRRNAQAIALAAVEPVAALVLVGAEIRRRRTRGRARRRASRPFPWSDNPLRSRDGTTAYRYAW